MNSEQPFPRTDGPDTQPDPFDTLVPGAVQNLTVPDVSPAEAAQDAAAEAVAALPHMPEPVKEFISDAAAPAAEAIQNTENVSQALQDTAAALQQDAAAAGHAVQDAASGAAQEAVNALDQGAQAIGFSFDPARAEPHQDAPIPQDAPQAAPQTPTNDGWEVIAGAEDDAVAAVEKVFSQARNVQPPQADPVFQPPVPPVPQPQQAPPRPANAQPQRPPQGMPPFGQPQIPQNMSPYGQPPQRNMNTPPYGQPPQGMPPYGQPPQRNMPPREQNRYPQQNMNMPPYAQQQPQGMPPYGQLPHRNMPPREQNRYPQQNMNMPPYAQQQPQGMSPYGQPPQRNMPPREQNRNPQQNMNMPPYAQQQPQGMPPQGPQQRQMPQRSAPPYGQPGPDPRGNPNRQPAYGMTPPGYPPMQWQSGSREAGLRPTRSPGAIVCAFLFLAFLAAALIFKTMAVESNSLTEYFNMNLFNRNWLIFDWVMGMGAALLMIIGLFVHRRPFIFGIGVIFLAGFVLDNWGNFGPDLYSSDLLRSANLTTQEIQDLKNGQLYLHIYCAAVVALPLLLCAMHYLVGGRGLPNGLKTGMAIVSLVFSLLFALLFLFVWIAASDSTPRGFDLLRNFTISSACLFGAVIMGHSAILAFSPYKRRRMR